MHAHVRLAAVVALVAASALTAINTPESSLESATGTDGIRSELSSTRSDNSDCIQINPDSSQQYWVGEPSSELSNAARELQSLVDTNTGSLRGVSYCTHYEGVVVFASASATTDAMGSVADVSRKYPSVEVAIEQNGLSIDEVNAAAAILASQAQSTNGIVSIGPNITTGGIEIGIDNSQISQEQAQQAVASQLSRTRFTAEQVPINFIAQNGTAINSTRAADFSPYAMGAELLSTVSGTTYACSAGVPISVNGGFKLLTAGHCAGSTYKNNGTTVGTQYTTAYPGNADIYGDWKLIQGSHYALKVFSGSLSSNATLSITGGNWGSRPNGEQICVSGRTTAQTCRYFVTGSYQYFTTSGVEAGHQLRMYHDSNLDGIGDRSGWQGGDSGGPCYYGNGSGGVVMNGIVKGRSIPSTGPITYYCTQLSGVRAWNPAANVG